MTPESGVPFHISVDSRRSDVWFEIIELIIRGSLYDFGSHSLYTNLKFFRRGIFGAHPRNAGCFMISRQNKHCATPRVLRFSLKVSSVLCQISCFSLHVYVSCRSSHDHWSIYLSRKPNRLHTHSNIVRPFSSHYLNIKKYQFFKKKCSYFSFWVIPLDTPRVPFRCLCAAIEGDVTKKFPTSIHWAGNRLKGRECNWSVLPYTTSSIQKIPGIELGKTANAVNFHSFLQVWSLVIVELGNWMGNILKWQCLCTWLSIILPLQDNTRL